MIVRIAAAVLVLAIAAPARADETALHSTVGWGATIEPDRISLSTQAGYDGGAHRAVATARVEAAIYDRLSAFVAATYGEEATSASRPAFGLAVQLTDPRTSPIGLRLTGAYKPEGFTEPEGELESVLVAAHLFDQHVARAFVAYGRDPEGNESDAEVGAGYLHHVADNVAIGATTRYRYALARKDPTQPRWDLIGGAVGDVAIDHWRIELLLGGSAAGGVARASTGVVSLVSVGLDL